MNTHLQFLKATLQIQQLEYQIAVAKAHARKEKIPYQTGILEEQLKTLYAAISKGQLTPKPFLYREISYVKYLQDLAEIQRWFNHYGIDTNIPTTSVPVGVPRDNQSAVIINSDVARWFGNSDYTSVLTGLIDEISFIGKYIQRYHEDSKEILRFGIMLKMQLRNRTTLEDAVRDIKRFSSVVPRIDPSKLLPIPEGLLGANTTYWTDVYYRPTGKYLLPYLDTEPRGNEIEECSILPASDLTLAAAAIKQCFNLIGALAFVYQDISDYRKFDNPVLFPKNPALLEAVLLSPELDEEERYVVLNYTQPQYNFLYFRFFTDALLRYRRIADTLSVLYNASLEL